MSASTNRQTKLSPLGAGQRPTRPSPLVLTGSTRERTIVAALSSFSSRGYDGTSLDALAVTLGVTKQTILHHFQSKEGLLNAVLAHAVDEIAEVVDDALRRRIPSGRGELEAVVRAVYSLVGRRPELLGILREAGRLGPPFDAQLVGHLTPLTERATAFLSDGQRSAERARRAVVAAYAALIAVATELEVLQSLGQAPSPRLLIRRRGELFRYLTTLLGIGAPAVPGHEPTGR